LLRDRLPSRALVYLTFWLPSQFVSTLGTHEAVTPDVRNLWSLAVTGTSGQILPSSFNR